MPTRSIQEVLKKSKSVFVEPNQSIFNVATLMLEKGESAALVVKDSKTLGIVTEQDLIKRVLLAGLDAKSTSIEKIMTRDTVTIQPNALFGHALYLMHEYDVKHIPVIDKGKAIGVVSKIDALFADVEEYAHNAKMLDEITVIL